MEFRILAGQIKLVLPFELFYKIRRLICVHTKIAGPGLDFDSKLFSPGTSVITTRECRDAVESVLL